MRSDIESARADAIKAPRFRILRALNSPLRVRVHVLIAAASVLAVTVLQLIAGGANAAAREASEEAFQASTTAALSGVTERIGVIRASLRAADSLNEAGVDLAKICDVTIHDPDRGYQRLIVLSSNGDYYCSSVPNTVEQAETVRQRPYFQAALSTGEDQVSGPLVGTLSGRLSLIVAHPLRTSARTVAVVVSSTDVGEVFRPLASRLADERIVLVGRDGAPYEPGVSRPPDLPQPIVEAASRSIERGEVCPVRTVDALAWTCSPVERYGLVVMVGRPVESVYALERGAIARQWNRIIGVVVLAVTAAVVQDFLFLRRIRAAYAATGLPALTMWETTSHDEIDALRDFAHATEWDLRRLQREVAEHGTRRATSERELLTTIAETVEIRYPFLRNHGDRVGRYARETAARLGISDDLDHIEFAARVHDLGKIAIADAIYLKPGQLDPIELTEMQLHASRGSEMAGRMRTVSPAVVEAIRHHHEQWDGSGYPDGLAGTAIPLWSRIISVADAYDAMTEERPYRTQPLTHAQAMQVLEDGAAKQWDAAAVAAFVEVVETGHKPGPQAGVIDRAAPA